MSSPRSKLTSRHNIHIFEITTLSEGEVLRVYAHIVSAADFPGDEADYGVYCFTFALDFDEADGVAVAYLSRKEKVLSQERNKPGFPPTYRKTVL